MFSKKRSKSQKTVSKKTKKVNSSNSESSDEQTEIDEIQIDLSGFELAPEDSSGIQLLLHQLFLKIRMDIVDLTKYIIDEQLNVGSVIKESEIGNEYEGSDEDTVYGVITVISLSREKDFKFVAQLKTLFLELSKQHATEQTKTYLTSVLNNPANEVGYIINERYLNLPPAVSVPLLKKLMFEIKAESQKNSFFKFTHYIVICKLYKESNSKKKQKNNIQNQEVLWCNIEEEIFDKEADARFEYSVTSDCDSGLLGSWTEDDAELLPFRRILLFSAAKMDSIMQQLSSLEENRSEAPSVKNKKFILIN